MKAKGLKSIGTPPSLKLGTKGRHAAKYMVILRNNVNSLLTVFGYIYGFGLLYIGGSRKDILNRWLLGVLEFTKKTISQF